MEGPPPRVVIHCGGARPPPGLERLQELANVRSTRTAGELAGALADAEVLFVADFRSADLARAWNPRGPLRWVHTAGAGVDTILFPALVESDVVLTNSRGVFDDAMAEYALGLIVAFAKDLPGTVALQARRTWRHRETERLGGARVLVVGAGPIGRRIGRLVGCVGMQVVVVGRTARPDPDFGRIFGVADLDALLPDADYVVLALPLTAETERLVDASRLGRMKPSARLLNFGRGALVDEDALLDALRSRRIAGAALDAFVREPLSADSPFWRIPGVIVSPHMSGDFVGWRDALSELFLDNFRRWQSGEPLLNVVDKRLGYVA